MHTPEPQGCAITSYTQHCISLANLFQDVELADAFFAGHRAPDFSAFPYPRELFLKFIAENDGARGCTAEACIAAQRSGVMHASCAESPPAAYLRSLLTLHLPCDYPAPHGLHAHQDAGAARGDMMLLPPILLPLCFACFPSPQATCLSKFRRCQRAPAFTRTCPSSRSDWCSDFSSQRAATCKLLHMLYRLKRCA